MHILLSFQTIAAVPTGISPEFEASAWSPYIVGAGVGVLSWLTFYFSKSALGASGGYATCAGLIGRGIAPRHTGSLPYYRENPPAINWGLLLLGGMLIGSFLAAWSGGEITNRLVPPMWELRFGEDSGLLRTGTAFSGGVLMAFGARLAGGCTSGHGISGTLQLSIGSWVSAACFFVGGVITANLLY